MKDDFSFIEIFQDPLLTLVVLILFSTVWVLIPKGPANVSGNDQINRARIESELNKLTKQIKEKREKVSRLRARLDALNGILDKDKKGARWNKDQIELLKAEAKIEQLEDLIRKEKDRLRELSERLAEAEKAKKISEEVKKLRQEIESIKEDISEKEKVLTSLREDLKRAKEEAVQSKRLAEKREQEIEKLKRLISIAREDIENYQREKRQLQATLNKLPGIAPYSKQAMENKDYLYFEASENKITVINPENYDVETFATVYEGKIVQAAKLTKKESAGESIKTIFQKGSSFQKELTNHDPGEYAVIFIVRSDSFDAFIKAREIAWNKGYVVGWEPLDGPIYAGPPGSGAGETSGRRR